MQIVLRKESNYGNIVASIRKCPKRQIQDKLNKLLNNATHTWINVLEK